MVVFSTETVKQRKLHSPAIHQPPPKESICFRAHEQMLGAVLEEVRLPDVANSGWPLLRLLGHVARVVRPVFLEGDGTATVI